MMTSQKDYDNLSVLILAAGKGSRMQAKPGSVDNCLPKNEEVLPKVLYELDNKPMLGHVLAAIETLKTRKTALVLGYKAEEVRRYALDNFQNLAFYLQEEQKGTGHAVLCAKPFLQEGLKISLEARLTRKPSLLLLYGDMPLISSDSMRELVNNHLQNDRACTVMSFISEFDKPYGRIVRDCNQKMLKIVEAKDANKEELEIREFNSGVYVFDIEALLPCLEELRPNNKQGEYYLTDVPAMLQKSGKKVDAWICPRAYEGLGVNTQEDLLYLASKKYLNEKSNDTHS